MLGMLFPSSELVEAFAAQQIEMITGSSNKAEYEEKLCAFSATTGEKTAKTPTAQKLRRGCYIFLAVF